MKKISITVLFALLLSLASGCFRKEIQVAEYSVPEMKTDTVGA